MDNLKTAPLFRNPQGKDEGHTPSGLGAIVRGMSSFSLGHFHTEKWTKPPRLRQPFIGVELTKLSPYNMWSSCINRTRSLLTSPHLQIRHFLYLQTTARLLLDFHCCSAMSLPVFGPLPLFGSLASYDTHFSRTSLFL